MTSQGLNGAYNIIQKCILLTEENKIYKNQIICEPKMSKRDLHPKEWLARHLGNGKELKKRNTDLMNIMVYSDGKNDIVDIAEKINIDFQTCLEYTDILCKKGILRCLDD